MEAKELRIGNYVNSNVSNCNNKKGLVEISLETFAKIRLQNALQHLEPIPLTEEWLVRFGFEYIKGDEIWIYKNFILNDEFFMMDIDIEICLTSVHQLQNLYYALTQTELEVK